MPESERAEYKKQNIQKWNDYLKSMNTKINGAQLAFPLFIPRLSEGEWDEGLSKRELFAAMAMQGFCANPDPSVMRLPRDGLAISAVEYADALIEELAKTKL